MSGSPMSSMLREAAAEALVIRLASALCAALHSDEQATITVDSDDPDPRMRAAAHFACYAGADRLLAAIERGDIPGVTLAACGCAHGTGEQRYCHTCVRLGASEGAKAAMRLAADRGPDCGCDCHRMPGVNHMAPCCDAPPFTLATYREVR